MLTGSCLCGEIYYEVKSSIQSLTYCHCSRCQKSSGSAFSTVGMIEKKSLIINDNNNALSSYKNGEVSRDFCRHCGSALFSYRESTPDIVRIRIGSIDTPLKGINHQHIFISSKATWHDITDDALQHMNRPIS